MPRLAQEQRSDGERPVGSPASMDRVLVALLVKYRGRVREFGAKAHASGHVKRTGVETASVPQPWDWAHK